MQQDVNFTAVLQKFSQGELQTADIMPIIYDELHRLAKSQRKKYASAETLNTTALVHEAYIKLVDHSHQNWETRSHFFAVAAKAMRCILVDHAKMHMAEKRGGNQKPIPFTEHLIGGKEQASEILNLDEALSKLETIAERQSRVIELRFFCGFSIEETAKILNLSPATVKRDWNLARSWLYKEINRNN